MEVAYGCPVWRVNCLVSLRVLGVPQHQSNVTCFWTILVATAARSVLSPVALLDFSRFRTLAMWLWPRVRWISPAFTARPRLVSASPTSITVHLEGIGPSFAWAASQSTNDPNKSAKLRQFACLFPNWSTPPRLPRLRARVSAFRWISGQHRAHLPG